MKSFEKIKFTTMRQQFSIIFVLFVSLTFGQNISIGLLRNNVLYIGIDNEFDFAIENHICKDYKIQSDNGIVKHIVENIYSLNPTHLGSASIYFINMNGDTIFRKEFRVKHIPEPEIMICKTREP